MTPLLKSVTINNFRSIRGEVTVQLDAPVVLIYGPNGAGKTSILSAMELGLTGQIPSFERLDPSYTSHLLHKETQKGRVLVTVDELNGVTRSADCIVTDSCILGDPLFSQTYAHFYSERCYLGQATLSRLLEIYENKDDLKNDSPLTKFVKDLLGLDTLDALTEGLFVAGDVRRLREPLPLYWRIRRAIDELENSIDADNVEREGIDTKIKVVNRHLRRRLHKLGGPETSIGQHAELLGIVEGHPEDRELARLANLRLEVVAMSKKLRTIQRPVDPGHFAKIEKEAVNAQAGLEDWRHSTGRKLENLFDNVSKLIPELSFPKSVRSQDAVTATIVAVGAELKRCSALLEHDTEDTAITPTMEQSISFMTESSAALDDQNAIIR